MPTSGMAGLFASHAESCGGAPHRVEPTVFYYQVPVPVYLCTSVPVSSSSETSILRVYLPRPSSSSSSSAKNKSPIYSKKKLDSTCMDEPSIQRLTQGQKRSIRLVFRNAAKERKIKMQKRDCDRQIDVALMKEKKQPYPCTRAAGSVLTGQGQGQSHVRASRYIPPSDQ